MFVCLCKAITEKKLRRIISEGSNNIKEIQQACKAGTSCGSCLCQIEDMIQDQKGKEKAKGTINANNTRKNIS